MNIPLPVAMEENFPPDLNLIEMYLRIFSENECKQFHINYLLLFIYQFEWIEWISMTFKHPFICVNGKNESIIQHNLKLFFRFTICLFVTYA